LTLTSPIVFRMYGLFKMVIYFLGLGRLAVIIIMDIIVATY